MLHNRFLIYIKCPYPTFLRTRLTKQNSINFREFEVCFNPRLRLKQSVTSHGQRKKISSCIGRYEPRLHGHRVTFHYIHYHNNLLFSTVYYSLIMGLKVTLQVNLQKESYRTVSP